MDSKPKLAMVDCIELDGLWIIWATWEGTIVAKLSLDQALLRAKSHETEKEITEAQKIYKAIIHAFPKNKTAQRRLKALSKASPSVAFQNPPRETIDRLVSLYNQGQLTASADQAQSLTLQYPNSPFVWNILGAAKKGLGRIEEASQAFTTVTKLNPSSAGGFSNLGASLKEQGKLEEAIAAYTKALSIKPDYDEAKNNMGNALLELGNALQQQGKLEQAITAYNKALSFKPNYSVIHNNLGAALQEQGKLEEAEKAFNKALSLKPDYAEAHNNLGVVLKALGKLEQAIAAYNMALSCKPDYAEAHRNLSILNKYEPNNLQIFAVTELLNRSDLEDGPRCHLHYTQAKIKEDLGELEVAFEHYVAGGNLRKKSLSYDIAQDKIWFDQIKKAAPEFANLSFSPTKKSMKHTPIFILGMPRSGTTLVEQIVSSHSHVQGAGELPHLIRLAGELVCEQQKINSDTLLGIRNTYLQNLAKVSNDRPFVTDKMPQNFWHIGLILSILPEAKIIHVSRDPSATCWSNFKHYFPAKGLGYSYNLGDTVGYFGMYQELMSYWHQRYSNRIFQLNYEKLTVEQEVETRKLFDHLELDWENAVLSPQKNKRSVRTTSQQQVKERVYTGSSQSWRKFEPFLKGAFDELGPVVV